MYDAMRTNVPIGNGYKQYRNSLLSLTQRLFAVAAIAKDADHRVVNAIGSLTATTPPYTDVQIRAMDQIVDALAKYTTVPPDYRTAAMHELEATLQDVVTTARHETEEFLAH
ncbi:hypothetical protein CQ044_15485 [Microbacterium sp. MYb64]|nr:hypothetical protein CQ044_15485 [Microbacterium sp. MYb64]